MYVWDISFSTAGPHLKAKVAIHCDSDENGIADSMDPPVSGATVGFTYTKGDVDTYYSGITDSTGAVEFMIKGASGTSGIVEVTSLTHDIYKWNPALDKDNPDSYPDL